MDSIILEHPTSSGWYWADFSAEDGVDLVRVCVYPPDEFHSQVMYECKSRGHILVPDYAYRGWVGPLVAPDVLRTVNNG